MPGIYHINSCVNGKFFHDQINHVNIGNLLKFSNNKNSYQFEAFHGNF